MRSLYAGLPFTTSTPEIEAALRDVSIPTLLLSLVHITGDPRFIREFKQMGIFLNEVQGFMSEEDKARGPRRGTHGDHRVSRPGLPRARAAEPRPDQGDAGLGRPANTFPTTTCPWSWRRWISTGSTPGARSRCRPTARRELAGRRDRVR